MCFATFGDFFARFAPMCNSMSPHRGEVCASFLKSVRNGRFRNVWVGAGGRCSHFSAQSCTLDGAHKNALHSSITFMRTNAMGEFQSVVLLRFFFRVFQHPLCAMCARQHGLYSQDASFFWAWPQGLHHCRERPTFRTLVPFILLYMFIQGPRCCHYLKVPNAGLS